MGIVYRECTKEKVKYSLIPEKEPTAAMGHFKAFKNQNMKTNGFTKEKSIRHIGKVPFAVMYNYALTNGIEAQNISKWFTEKKGKNMRKLLQELPTFKMVDKI